MRAWGNGLEEVNIIQAFKEKRKKKMLINELQKPMEAL